MMETTETDLSGYKPLKVAIIGHDAPMRWVKAGWADLKRSPALGLGTGLAFFLLSWAVVGFLFYTKLEWMLGPAIAGAMLVGPVLATGLYRESRREIARAKGTDTAPEVKLNAPQVALVGTVLMSLMLIWIRAAVIIYALFFGLLPFPGIAETFTRLFLTQEGLTMLAVGSAVGGLFAALVFSISAFSIPMMVDEDVDGFTAMGSSFVATTRNFWVMVRWGIIIIALSMIGFATAFIGMIVVFPVLGHATWHAYDEVFLQGDA